MSLHSQSNRRRGIIIALSALIIAALAFAFFAGTRYAPKGATPQEQAEAEVKVWGQIENRPVNSALSYPGTAHTGNTVPLTITAPADPILVHQNKQPSDTVTAGDLIGIVGGEGIYALNGPLPLYRPLVLGDSGHDVLELQRALTEIGYASNTDGTVTEATLEAVSNLLHSELTGLAEEEISTINPSNFAILPQGALTVATVASVGSTISEANPLLTLYTSSSYAEFNAPLKDINTLSGLSALTITSSAGSTNAHIASIGDMQTGNDGVYRTVSLTPDNPEIIVPNQTLTVSTAGDSTPVLAVPVSAVRQDGSKTYIITQNQDGQEERLEVEVIRTGEGYAAISGNISQGQKVLIS